MAKKPKMRLFAGIKYDWQQWAADKNIVKKIFWFIWLVIWTILKVLFSSLFILIKGWLRLKSHYDVDPDHNYNTGETCRVCKHYTGRKCGITGASRSENASCGKFSIR